MTMCKNRGKRPFFRTYCSQNTDFNITNDHSFTSDLDTHVLENSFFHCLNSYNNFLDNFVKDYIDSYDFLKKNIIEKRIGVYFSLETGTYRSKKAFLKRSLNIIEKYSSVSFSLETGTYRGKKTFSKKNVFISEKYSSVSFSLETGTYRSKNDFGDVAPSTIENSEEVSMVLFSPPIKNKNSEEVSIVLYVPPSTNEENTSPKVPPQIPPRKDYSHLWVPCDECDMLNFKKFFFEKLYVCEHCDSYVKLPSSLRIELSIDTGTWISLDKKNEGPFVRPALDPWVWDGTDWDAPEESPVELVNPFTDRPKDFTIEVNPLGEDPKKSLMQMVEELSYEISKKVKEQNAESYRQGEHGRNAESYRQGEHERNAESHQEGEYERNAESHQEGEYERNAESHQEGEPEIHGNHEKEKTTEEKINHEESDSDSSYNYRIRSILHSNNRPIRKNIPNSPDSFDNEKGGDKELIADLGENLGSENKDKNKGEDLGGNPMENGSGDLGSGMDSAVQDQADDNLGPEDSGNEDLDAQDLDSLNRGNLGPEHGNLCPEPSNEFGVLYDFSVSMDTEHFHGSDVQDHYSVNMDPGDGNKSDIPDPVLHLDNNIERDNELPGRGEDNGNVDPDLGRRNNNACRDGQVFESNLESEGYADVPFRNLFGEGYIFNYMVNCPLVPTSSYSDANRLHNRSYRLYNQFYKRVDTLVESQSQVKKDSDSDSESESDDKEEKEFDSFLSIPFFIKNRELDLDSPCIPLIPTLNNKTEKRKGEGEKKEWYLDLDSPLIPTLNNKTEKRKGEDEWKKELYSDKVKVASHHVNWWRQRKEEGSDWYSDKVKDACQQLAEVDWFRHWNQQDWDNHAYLLEGIDLELGREEEEFHLTEEELEELELDEEDLEKHYVTRTFYDQDRLELSEAIQTGLGQLNGIPVALGVMDFEFIGGSMGYEVGDRITRLIKLASHLGLPLIIVCASGGARMQEGTLSLMQMAKISSALHYFKKNQKNPLYISMLASPTTGGVTASFGMLGDIIISEPEAYIAFAGKRVIEDTLKLEVPEGSQVAEVAFEKGLLDPIIPREMLKGVLSELLQLHNYFPLTPKIKGFLS